MTLPAPYYRDEAVTLYQGDVDELLPLLARGDFDLVLADQPYGDTSLEWDALSSGWLRFVVACLTPSGSLWCWGSLRAFMEQTGAFRLAGLRLAQDVIWHKHNGSGFHADRFRRVHEHAVQFYPSTSTWGAVYKAPQFTQDATARTRRSKKRPPHLGAIDAKPYQSIDGGPRLMTSVLAVPSCHGYAVHPTQKPEAMIRPLVEYSCPPGGRVLSLFSGSGTDLVVARDSGRLVVGVEIDEGHCRNAVARLAQQPLRLASTTTRAAHPAGREPEKP